MWRLARRLLVCASVLAAVGITAVGTGRTLESNTLPSASLAHSILPAPELLHHSEQVPAAGPAGSHMVWMEVTAYCPCKKCCGPNAAGITASGRNVSYNDGKFVAADTSLLPFGTKLLIPGYVDQPVEVIDRGGAIKGNKLDVFFDSHQAALQWGRQMVMVTVVN